MSKVLDQIKKNAIQTPERIAYTVESETDAGYICSSLTWKELEKYSNSIAFFLMNHLKTNSPIVVFGHKDPMMIVAFLGCVKSGRAYVPVDSSFPERRVKDIIQAVDPEVVISIDQLLVTDIQAQIITKENIKTIIDTYSAESESSNYVSGEDVFYIIFTSGSTGTPKGVQITSDCLDNFVNWVITLGDNYMNDEGHHTFINQAPFSFDLSVFDLYLTLYSGGTEYAISKTMQNDMDKVYDYLGASNADVWVSTPSFAEIALADSKFNESLLPNMKLFLFCGETLTNQTVEKLHAAFPKAEVINTYGPTESTVAMTSVLVTDELCNKYNPLPIGVSKPGTTVYIMDEEGNVLPEGEKGEIVIVGDTVSTGYWKNSEKNAEVFGTREVDGVNYRMYHTHDKGYYSDGMLFYCGRIDLQIKLHGYRIEIEDIESNILAVLNVERVVVMPEYNNGEVVNLIAYVVPHEMPDSALKERKRIREELKRRIPEYMIPKKFVFKNSLPVTTNGKVDRKKLEEIEQC